MKPPKKNWRQAAKEYASQKLGPKPTPKRIKPTIGRGTETERANKSAFSARPSTAKAKPQFSVTKKKPLKSVGMGKVSTRFTGL